MPRLIDVCLLTSRRKVNKYLIMGILLIDVLAIILILCKRKIEKRGGSIVIRMIRGTIDYTKEKIEIGACRTLDLERR